MQCRLQWCIRAIIKSTVHNTGTAVSVEKQENIKMQSTGDSHTPRRAWVSWPSSYTSLPCDYFLIGRKDVNGSPLECAWNESGKSWKYTQQTDGICLSEEPPFMNDSLFLKSGVLKKNPCAKTHCWHLLFRLRGTISSLWCLFELWCPSAVERLQ